MTKQKIFILGFIFICILQINAFSYEANLKYQKMEKLEREREKDQEVNNNSNSCLFGISPEAFGFRISSVSGTGLFFQEYLDDEFSYKITAGITPLFIFNATIFSVGLEFQKYFFIEKNSSMYLLVGTGYNRLGISGDEGSDEAVDHLFTVGIGIGSEFFNDSKNFSMNIDVGLQSTIINEDANHYNEEDRIKYHLALGVGFNFYL